MPPNSVSQVRTAAQDAALFYVYFAHSRVRMIPAITLILDTKYYYFSSEAPWLSSLAVVAPSVTGYGSAHCTASTASTSHCLAVANSD